MKKPATKTLIKREYAEFRAAINWYASIVTWLLNRCENTPFALVELIRERSHELHMEFGVERKKDDEAQD